MTVWLSAEGRAALLSALGGKRLAASDLESWAAGVLADETGRDRLEELFRSRAFATYLSTWKLKSTRHFEALTRALFEKASRSARRETAELQCAALARPDFRKSLDPLVRPEPDIEGIFRYAKDLLDVAAAGEGPVANYIGLMEGGDLRKLRRAYAFRSPEVYDWLGEWPKKLAAAGAPLEALQDFLDFLCSPELEGLALLAAGRTDLASRILRPFLERESLGTAPVPARAALGALGKIVATVPRLPGLSRREAATGIALALAPAAASLDEAGAADFEFFARHYGFFKRPEGPPILARFAERPELYARELAFFAQEELRSFFDFAALNFGSDFAAFTLEIMFSTIEPERAVGVPPEFPRLATSLLLGKGDWKSDRAYWKARAALFAQVARRSSSKRIRGLLLGAAAEDLALIARKRFCLEGGALTLPPRASEAGRLIEAFLAEQDGRRGQKERGEAIPAFFARLARLAWAPAFERLGEGRKPQAIALYGAVRALDLDDRALSELEALPEDELDRWLGPALAAATAIAGDDPETARSFLAERLARDYWRRLHFPDAYPSIMELVIPVAGSIECLQDPENQAKTDGRRIWLPAYVGIFPDPPESLPDNRNLTVYAGLALHEAGHIIGGSFALDTRALTLSLERPLLFHSITNAFEDCRIEEYLRLAAPHPQVEAILKALNLSFYRKPSGNALFDFLIACFAQAAGFWEEAVAANPDFQASWEAILAAGFPGWPHGTTRELAEHIVASLRGMDACDPTAALRLAAEVYDCLRLWQVPDPDPATPAGPGGGLADSLAGSGLTLRDAETLEALAERFEENPEGMLRELGLEPNGRVLAERARRKPSGGTLSATEGKGTTSAGSKEAAGTKGSPERIDTGASASGEGEAYRVPGLRPLIPSNRASAESRAQEALDRIAEAALLASAQYAYRERGRVEAARYASEDTEEAARQKRGAPDGRRDPRSGKPDQRPRRSPPAKAKRGNRLVRARNATDPDRLFSVCREIPITKVDRDFLRANRRYDSLSRRIARMLSTIIDEASQTDPELSAFEGDIDDERLVEILADPLRLDDRFLEFADENRRSLAVLVGIDASGSTAATVRRAGMTVLDIEKHFALIFARALGMLTREVSLLAFNTGSGTNIYRPEPPEALSSLSPGAANRDGDFIRYCRAELAGKEAEVKYLFLISDGMPSAEGYEGRAALDDTILAMEEARKEGIKLVYLNIDSATLEYFPRMAQAAVFSERFARPAELISAVPRLVRSLAREVL